VGTIVGVGDIVGVFGGVTLLVGRCGRKWVGDGVAVGVVVFDGVGWALWGGNRPRWGKTVGVGVRSVESL